MEGVVRQKINFAPYKNLYEEKDLNFDPSKPVDALTSRKLIEQAAKRVWHNGGEVPKEFADKFTKEFYRQRYFFKLNQEMCQKPDPFYDPYIFTKPHECSIINDGKRNQAPHN